MEKIDYESEYEALREYLNAARGWPRGSISLTWLDGWWLYVGPYPLVLKGEEKATCFTTAKEAVAALRRYMEYNAPFFRPEEE